jgi:hypothetical protein
MMQTLCYSHLQVCCFQEAEAEVGLLSTAVVEVVQATMVAAEVLLVVLVQVVVVQEVHSLLLAL